MTHVSPTAIGAWALHAHTSALQSQLTVPEGCERGCVRGVRSEGYMGYMCEMGVREGCERGVSWCVRGGV